jgi:hypothetical protein
MRSVALLLAMLTAAAWAEDPQPATVCQIKSNPATYDQKLVKVVGFAANNAGTFTIYDPHCQAWPEIWLDAARRSKPVTVAGVSVPLTEDKAFRDFDKLFQRPPDSLAHATVIGRYFAGNHYGRGECCSLLVLQQVLAVDPQDRNDVDYASEPDHPTADRNGCGYKVLLRSTGNDSIAAQEGADAGPRAWAFDDPARVAAAALTDTLKLEPGASLNMSQAKKGAGRLVYEWKPAGKKESYMVVLSRPYWLSFYAKDPKKVAWVVMAAYDSTCQ